MDLVDSDHVDLLDLDRAGPVARQHALVPGDPLYEYRPGEFARQQMRASGQRLGTEWMRRLDLALMADPMTPRRLDPSIVQARLSVMRGLLDDLAAVNAAWAPLLAENRIIRHGVERILTQLVEIATAINEHVAGARLQRVATSYGESFGLALECGLIDKQLHDDLLPSVGMRNILVHEYIEIDLGKVTNAIPLALNCYRRYVQQVAEFVSRVG